MINKNIISTEKGNVTTKLSLKFFVISKILVAVTLLSGCSAFNTGKDEYSCSGVPDVTQCLSARDVYLATNDGESLIKTKSEAVLSKQEQTVEGNGVDVTINNYVTPNLPDKPIPIRTPAEIMRIWVAPWEDTQGDLIVSGYVYTEIEHRRWVIGTTEPTSKPTLRLLTNSEK